MTSNTVEIESHPVNFASFSVEKRTYKPDPFAIKDGRSVGSDGFVVPKDFPEFFKRFPDYVQKWVSRHAPAAASEEDKEDWTQDLLIHLSRLPLTSKYRKAGKKDIVETFDPLRHYGANEARFRNYINLCLANKFRTMHSQRMRDALCRPNKASIDGVLEPNCSVADDYCQSNSPQLREAAKASEKHAADKAFMQDFVRFVHRHEPKTLPVIEALGATRTQAEAADFLGVTEAEFGRMRYRLDRLRRCFLIGEPIPKPRRPYKKRIGKPAYFSL